MQKVKFNSKSKKMKSQNNSNNNNNKGRRDGSPRNQLNIPLEFSQLSFAL